MRPLAKSSTEKDDSLSKVVRSEVTKSPLRNCIMKLMGLSYLNHRPEATNIKP